MPRAWILDKAGKHILLSKIPETARRLAGHWELPELKALENSPSQQTLLAKKSRGISNQRISEPIHQAPPPSQLPEGHVWVKIKDLPSIQLTGPHRRWIQELLKK